MSPVVSVLCELTLQQWADLDEDEPGELVDGRRVVEERIEVIPL
jgi:hypothetical protein